MFRLGATTNGQQQPWFYYSVLISSVITSKDGLHLYIFVWLTGYRTVTFVIKPVTTPMFIMSYIILFSNFTL